VSLARSYADGRTLGVGGGIDADGLTLGIGLTVLAYATLYADGYALGVWGPDFFSILQIYWFHSIKCT
jgi:hypothetical protein